MVHEVTEPTFAASSAAVDVGSSWKRKLPSLDLIRMSWQDTYECFFFGLNYYSSP